MTLATALWMDRVRTLAPGVTACAVTAAAAAFLSGHYGAPVMLFALLLGLAMNALASGGPCAAGVDFTARVLLRAGIALLGLRIGFGQLQSLGWQPVLLVAGSMVLTIGGSVLAARWMGFRGQFGLLTGGATAICGASAALALAAALPPHPLKERATLFTVIGVSALSTLAMIGYPLLARAIGLDATQAGVFLGATIHDVAQVVGAGYGLSRETGDVATVVKLLRVALLLPVILVAVAITRRQAGTAGEGGGTRPPLLPGFVVAFVALVAFNSTGWVPGPVQSLGGDASRACLVAAMAAIGMKTRLAELATVGFKPVVLMLGETLFLASLVLAWLRWSPAG